MRLFINILQMTSKCDKNISDTFACSSCGTSLILRHFDVICDLLLKKISECHPCVCTLIGYGQKPITARVTFTTLSKKQIFFCSFQLKKSYTAGYYYMKSNSKKLFSSVQAPSLMKENHLANLLRTVLPSLCACHYQCACAILNCLWALTLATTCHNAHFWGNFIVCSKYNSVFGFLRNKKFNIFRIFLESFSLFHTDCLRHLHKCT